MENKAIKDIINSYSWLKANEYATSDESYPIDYMQKLQSSDLMLLNVPQRYGGISPNSGNDNVRILNVLKLIGERDLSVGRIFEGHINAMILIHKYATENQKKIYFSEAKHGMLFGIWNSEHPSEPLEIFESNHSNILKGAKVFCSGANNVFRPIVTAQGRDGQQMVILHLDEYHLEEDYTYWQPMGMISSVSCRFDFTDVQVSDEQFLGYPYSYYGEPDFSGGSLRFAAVQLGGASACIKATVSHLKRLNRTDDVHQNRRMAKIAVLQKTGELWLGAAGKAYDNRYEKPDECLYIANMFRTVVSDLCEKVLSLCEKSIGLQGFLKPHPLQRIHRDLSVYLKQPAPDKTLSEVGKYFIKEHATDEE